MNDGKYVIEKCVDCNGKPGNLTCDNCEGKGEVEVLWGYGLRVFWCFDGVRDGFFSFSKQGDFYSIEEARKEAQYPFGPHAGSVDLRDPKQPADSNWNRLMGEAHEHDISTWTAYLTQVKDFKFDHPSELNLNWWKIHEVWTDGKGFGFVADRRIC